MTLEAHDATNALTQMLGIEVPIICGAMYPCSNPELVAAASEAGGIGIVQPMALTHVFGHDFRSGLRLIRRLTSKPIGLNVIVERSIKRYESRLRAWVDIALEEGVRLFITALGNPAWVVERADSVGAVVFHDVTERRWAEKALEHGVSGLICVNQRAGGHAGPKSPEALYAELRDLGVPLICAGGIGCARDFVHALRLGYAGVQMGTRFIATQECTAHDDYKQAILRASEADIIMTSKLSGVPCAVINTAHVQKTGTHAGPIGRWLLRHPKTKRWMRTFYSLRSIRQLRRASLEGGGYLDYWSAGKSVAGISSVHSVSQIMRDFVAEL